MKKKLYTFYWTDTGKKYEPLQASSERQALWLLIYKHPDDKFKILNGFRNDVLKYKIGIPYQQIPKPKPEHTQEQLPLFKDFIRA